MRPQQQNRRMRGRGNNNNRKGPNPLTRSYESNGPDVKIRGTAQQVADKYTTLARDAQSSGDRVIAENYLQHAEHYNRLIAAAQAQLQPQQPQQNTRDNREDDEDEREERQDDRQDRQQDREAQRSSSPQRQQLDDGSGPQPVLEGMPAEVALKDRRNGRGNGAKANGASEAGEEAVSKQDEQAPEASEAEAPAPKPRRTRRPRAKASEESKPDNGEASEKPAEEAATQG